MRYLLTLDGVPLGRFLAPDPTPDRCACHLEPLPGFGGSGLADHALRIGEWLALTHGPRARSSPRIRKLGRDIHDQRPHWRARLGILDGWGVHVPVAAVEVIWFATRRPFVTLDFRLSLAQEGAVCGIIRVRDADAVVPAA
jgi:hypothetical protein